MVRPISSPQSNGFKPHPTGVLLPALEQDMVRRAQDPEDRLGPRPTEGTRLRASYALTCARQMGFNILGVPECEPVPVEVLFTFDLGHIVHMQMQGVMEREFKNCQTEVTGTFGDIDISCHADAVYDQMLFNPGAEDVAVRVCGEIKSISGYGFMIAVGMRKSSDNEMPGPKVEHICQAAICAMANEIQAKKIHLIYYDKDKSSIAEWILDMDEPVEKLEGMTPRDLALSELDRMNGILGRLDNGLLPARHIPGKGRIEVVPDPDSRGQPWNCRYCRWNAICKDMPPGPVPITEAIPSFG